MTALAYGLSKDTAAVFILEPVLYIEVACVIKKSQNHYNALYGHCGIFYPFRAAVGRCSGGADDHLLRSDVQDYCQLKWHFGQSFFLSSY